MNIKKSELQFDIATPTFELATFELDHNPQQTPIHPDITTHIEFVGTTIQDKAQLWQEQDLNIIKEKVEKEISSQTKTI